MYLYIRGGWTNVVWGVLMAVWGDLMAVWGGLEVVWGGLVEVWGGLGGLGCFNGPVLHLCSVMSTRFACGGFSPGSLVFPTT